MKVQVVHAVIKKNGKFLLGKRSLAKEHAPGSWASIGGRLEGQESLEACLIRECLEEIDVRVKPIRMLLEVIESQGIHYWFEAEIISGVPRLANDEHSELKWFTKLEVETLLPIVDEDLKIILGT